MITTLLNWCFFLVLSTHYFDLFLPIKLLFSFLFVLLKSVPFLFLFSFGIQAAFRIEIKIF